MFFRYAQRAKELSQRFRDRPQPAIETAKFWVEYVIRHEGADHIKSPTTNKLGFIRYHNIDVLGLLLVMLLIVVLVPPYLLTRCTKRSEGGLLLYKKWE
jgi:glucuronosyltransferase